LDAAMGCQVQSSLASIFSGRPGHSILKKGDGRPPYCCRTARGCNWAGRKTAPSARPHRASPAPATTLAVKPLPGRPEA
jgi:hypothetical protein